MPTKLKARSTRFDLANTPLHWVPNDPEITHFWNVLHIVLPPGERWFADVFRDAMPLVTDDALLEQMKGFVAQETTHAKAHDRGLEFMAANGLDARKPVARIDKAARVMHRFGQRLPNPIAQQILKSELAMIASVEHYTSVMGQWFLENHGLDETGADANMVDLLRWHASEEVEHRSVAFDTFQHVSGGYRRRAVSGVLLSGGLILMWLGIGSRLMIADKSAKGWRLRLRHLRRAGKRGQIPPLNKSIPWLREYLKRDYHPSRYGTASLDLAIAYLASSPGVNHRAAS